MNWKRIRLELARTEGFPEGSANRAYLLRLPLDSNGFIDEAARSSRPRWATVRRFWPSERDLSGYVVRSQNGWAFSYRRGDEEDELIFHLKTHPIREGEYVTLTEPDGRELPFRVTSIEPFGRNPVAEP